MKILIYHSVKEKLDELLKLTVETLKDYKVEIDCFNQINTLKINKKKYDLSIVFMDKDYLMLVRYLDYHHCINILLSNTLDDVPIALYLNAYAFIYKRYHFHETLLKAVKHHKHNNICLYIETERKLVKVLLKDIIYLELCDDETKIITKEHIYHGIIKDIHKLLPKLSLYQFIQVHRNFIIHLPYLQGYRQKEVIMNNGHVLPLSLKYKHLFLKSIL